MRSAARKVIILLSVLGLAVAAQACTSDEYILPLEKRAQEIDKSVMCPICPGESIDQSQNVMAKQMRAVVREKLKAGWSPDEVRQFFVDRYGPSVLLAPPERGFSLLAWLLPPSGVLVVAIVLFFVIRTMKRTQIVTQETSIEGISLSQKEMEAYSKRIQALLQDNPASQTENSDG